VQASLFDAPTAANGPSLADELRRLDEQADDSVAAVRKRATRYRELQEQAVSEKIAFDLWTAAFFQPLTSEHAQYVPTTRDLLDHQARPKRVADVKVALAVPLAEEVGFFHWELEFPQIFDREVRSEKSEVRSQETSPSHFSLPTSGFDVVLGNPPWERIKLQEQEHFADVVAIRDAANKAARVKMIAAWRGGDDRQRTRIAEFDAAKYRAEAESRFIRASERFPLTAVGDVNTYALFAEHSRDLLAPTGRAGIIVPTGIATDDSAKAFFGDVVTRQQLVSFYDFENREAIFPGVHRSYKFSLLTVGATTQPTRFLFFATNVGQLGDDQRAFSLTPEEIALLNPNTRTAPVFRTRQDAELTKKIYRRAPVLLNERAETNPWGVTFLRMFDMSNDSGLFKDAPGEGLLPLYEAKMVWHFNHKWATYYISETREVASDELKDPYYSINPRYWISEAEANNRISTKGFKNKGWLIGYRDITNNTNERTAVFGCIPFAAVGNKFPIILSDTTSPLLISCFLATTSAISFDYAVRQKIGGTTLNYFLVYQLPVLPPDRFTPADIAYIVPRVVELVYTAWDIKAFAEDIWAEGDEALRAELLRRNAECNVDTDATLFAPRDGFALPPYRWDEGRRALARAELDARIAKLYGLTRDELRYILDPADVYGPEFPGETFRVLKEKETKRYGEYRTRRLVLEAWDREEGR